MRIQSVHCRTAVTSCHLLHLGPCDVASENAFLNAKALIMAAVWVNTTKVSRSQTISRLTHWRAYGLSRKLFCRVFRNVFSMLRTEDSLDVVSSDALPLPTHGSTACKHENKCLRCKRGSNPRSSAPAAKTPINVSSWCKTRVLTRDREFESHSGRGSVVSRWRHTSKQCYQPNRPAGSEAFLK